MKNFIQGATTTFWLALFLAQAAATQTVDVSKSLREKGGITLTPANAKKTVTLDNDKHQIVVTWPGPVTQVKGTTDPHAENKAAATAYSTPIAFAARDSMKNVYNFDVDVTTLLAADLVHQKTYRSLQTPLGGQEGFSRIYIDTYFFGDLPKNFTDTRGHEVEDADGSLHKSPGHYYFSPILTLIDANEEHLRPGDIFESDDASQQHYDGTYDTDKIDEGALLYNTNDRKHAEEVAFMGNQLADYKLADIRSIIAQGFKDVVAFKVSLPGPVKCRKDEPGGKTRALIPCFNDLNGVMNSLFVGMHVLDSSAWMLPPTLGLETKDNDNMIGVLHRPHTENDPETSLGLPLQLAKFVIPRSALAAPGSYVLLTLLEKDKPFIVIGLRRSLL